MDMVRRVVCGPGLRVDWNAREDRSEYSGRSGLVRTVEMLLILSLILGCFAVDWESLIFRDSTHPASSGRPETSLALALPSR